MPKSTDLSTIAEQTWGVIQPILKHLQSVRNMSTRLQVYSICKEKNLPVDQLLDLVQKSPSLAGSEEGKQLVKAFGR